MAGVFAFDAANLVMDTLERSEGRTGLKEAILTGTNQPGPQGPLDLERLGDVRRKDCAIRVVRDAKIVAVEGDDLVRQVAASVLEDLGFSVTSCKRPSQAVDQCVQGAQRFDLLMTDVVMPEVSGKALRNLMTALRPGISVPLISGYTSNVIVQHGVLEEGVNFVAKPFDLTDLAQKALQAMS